MDKNVTAKLFRMERSNDAIPRFIDVLRSIDAIVGHENRERQIATGFVIRLEHLEEENNHVVCGELTRIQTTNFPSEITPEGRQALSIENRLGHSLVFRANHHAGLLGIEANNRVCSPGRLFTYMADFNPDATYNVRPLVRLDAWERFNRSGPRKLQLAVASPTDLRALEGDGRAVGQAIAAMGEAYDAPKITVEISMGHARGRLGDRLRGLVESVLHSSQADDIELDKLKVFNDENPDGIDFTEELLIFKETLELHDRDPETNFQIKKRYLQRVMHGRT